ncbi:hypothetical protein JXM67_02875 [candidate division WOR-3 bacterium]|nr:hypothetical protein [candidate division WOR-3 bacterium]
MIKRSAIILLTWMFFTTVGHGAYTDHGRVGLGIQAGEPSGLSFKYWLTPNTALDVEAGWNVFTERPSAQFAYLLHFPLNLPTVDLSPYSGMGLTFGILNFTSAEADSLHLAGRVPVGLEYVSGRLGVYGEVDVFLNFIPDNKLGVGGGVGLRFYF